jgi:hypothetical protein
MTKFGMHTIRTILLFLILFLIPMLSFGQLFPSVPDFNGKIDKVIEKHYGKEVYLFNRLTGIYLPRFYSGWTYTYTLNGNGTLNREIHKFKGNLRVDYFYEYDSSENRTFKREIVNGSENNDNGDYIEDEYIFDVNGRIEKVNIWSFHSADSSKEILVVGKYINYDSLNNITSYYRHGIDKDGKEIMGELYILCYDSLSKVIRVEEKSVEQKTAIFKSDDNTISAKDIPGLKPTLSKEWIYKYNSKGQVISYTIKNYGEPSKFNSNGRKDYKVFFKYDKSNNWIKMYKQSGNSRKRLEVKRTIEYK